MSLTAKGNGCGPSEPSGPEKEAEGTDSRHGGFTMPSYGPDSVHSWITAVACSLSTFFGVAARRSAGFLYVAILQTFHANRSEAAWAVIIMTGIISLAGLISGPIAHKYTARPVAIAGGVIAALGLMLCFLATRIEHLIMSLGIFHAIGSGLVFVVIPTVINEHFVRYRGMAMGINFAGSTMATFVFPKTLEVLTNTYGFRGAMLLFGAISLNSVAFSLFLRQPEWLKRRQTIQAKADAAAAEIAANAHATCKTSNGSVQAVNGDLGYVTRQTLVTVTFLCLGSLFVLVPLASTYAVLFAFATAIAFCIGVVMCLVSVLLAEYVGLDRVSMAYGMVSGFSGVTSLFKPIIIGYFRDVVGAYDKLFIICGSGVVLGGFMWIAVRLVEKNKRTKRWRVTDLEGSSGALDTTVLPKYIYTATDLHVTCPL